MPKKDPLIKNLGQRIDQMRKEKDWSFQIMADKCEMDKAQVYKICTQGVDLRYSSLVKIAKGFNVSVSTLLTL